MRFALSAAIGSAVTLLALTACGNGDEPEAPVVAESVAEPAEAQAPAAAEQADEPETASEVEFEGAFAPTPDALRYVRSSLAFWDELQTCARSPRFAEAGFAPAMTPCRGWLDRASALAGDPRASREALRTGFDCLAGDAIQVGLAMIPPMDESDRQLVEYFTPKFEACRDRLHRWETSRQR